MAAEILKGAPAAAALLEKLKRETASFGRTPKLVLIGVEGDPSLGSYAKGIRKSAKEAGIEFRFDLFPADVSDGEYLQAVKAANEDPETDGVLLSMPLPERFSFGKMQDVMDPGKDVDGVSLVNRAKLYEGLPCLYPCTAEAVFRFLEFHGISVAGKHAVVVGRSPVVGRPVALGLLARDATVTVCHTKTENLRDLTKEADILVTAAGCSGLIRKEDVKEGAVVIDLGMSAGEDGKIVGDVEMEGVSSVASKIAPTMGGVGVLTTAILLEHTLISAKR